MKKKIFIVLVAVFFGISSTFAGEQKLATIRVTFSCGIERDVPYLSNQTLNDFIIDLLIMDDLLCP